ncbi:MAG: hypothetical protein ABI480_02140 [Chitinophagaceae bacterium]
MIIRSLLSITLLIPIVASSQCYAVLKFFRPKPVNKASLYFHQKQIDTVLYPNKKIKEIGQYTKKDWPFSCTARTGYWKEYYENGQLKSFGEYQSELIENFWGHTGPYTVFYKIGYWIYYYKNGQLKALGKYNLEETGERRESLITDNWLLYDSLGNRIKDKSEFIPELNCDCGLRHW